jgi:predicted Zn-ribbon and HTH transcriptional regulator
LSSCNEFAETACRLTLETGAPPHHLLPHVRRLRRLATSHQRRCVVQCNGCPTCQGYGFIEPGQGRPIGCEADAIAGARPCPTCQTDTIEEAIRGVCGELSKLRAGHHHAPNGTGALIQRGFAPIFTHDPRGATVKLHLPSGTTNSFGGEGWCVPTTGRV